MNPVERLRQAKAEYDQHIDAILNGLDCDDQEFARLTVFGRRAATAWADALCEAALEMDYTLQLDKKAEEAPKRLEHLLSFVLEFRMRHQNGDEGKSGRVPLHPILPLQSGSAAKPLGQKPSERNY